MPTSVLQFHTTWSWIVVFSNAAAGLWCLGAHWLAPLRVRALWWLVIAAEVSTGISVILGVILLAGQDFTAPEFHVFYGFLTIVAIAILYSYRFQIRAWQYLLYGFGSLFIMGLAIRAMFLG